MSGPQVTVSGAPALGFSIQIGAGDRQVVLQTHIDNNQPLPELKAMLGKLADAGDWLKARYDLETLLREQAATERTFRQAQEDQLRCETDWQEKLKGLQEELGKRVEKIDRVRAEHSEKRAASGRRTEGEPSAQTQSAIKAAQLDAKTLAASIATLTAEHDKDLRNWTATAAGWEKEIGRINGEMQRLTGIIGG